MIDRVMGDSYIQFHWYFWFGVLSKEFEVVIIMENVQKVQK